MYGSVPSMHKYQSLTSLPPKSLTIAKLHVSHMSTAKPCATRGNVLNIFKKAQPPPSCTHRKSDSLDTILSHRSLSYSFGFYRLTFTAEIVPPCSEPTFVFLLKWGVFEGARLTVDYGLRGTTPWTPPPPP